MVLTFSLFSNSYFHIVTITFSTLILTEILNVYSELNRITFATVAFTIGTLIIYIASTFLLSELLDVKAIDMTFGMNIVFIAFICWLPFFAINRYLAYKEPDDYQQIMELVRS